MKLGSTETHLSSRVSRRKGHTFATTFLPRICCQKYSGYPRVSFLSFDRTRPSASSTRHHCFPGAKGTRLHSLNTVAAEFTVSYPSRLYYSICSVLHEKI